VEGEIAELVTQELASYPLDRKIAIGGHAEVRLVHLDEYCYRSE